MFGQQLVRRRSVEVGAGGPSVLGARPIKGRPRQGLPGRAAGEAGSRVRTQEQDHFSRGPIEMQMATFPRQGAAGALSAEGRPGAPERPGKRGLPLLTALQRGGGFRGPSPQETALPTWESPGLALLRLPRARNWLAGVCPGAGLGFSGSRSFGSLARGPAPPDGCCAAPGSENSPGFGAFGALLAPKASKPHLSASISRGKAAFLAVAEKRGTSALRRVRPPLKSVRGPVVAPAQSALQSTLPWE